MHIEGSVESESQDREVVESSSLVGGNVLKVYLARGMSHRVKSEIVEEAKKDKDYFEKAGITVLCPVEKEQVKSTDEKLMASKKLMENYWPQDKAMIREAHLLFDMTPTMNSEGCKHEIGYARYFLYKPVVRVFPKGELPIKSSVAFFEDDIVVDSREEALAYAYREHGTLYRRLKWRFKLYNRCFLGMVRAFIGGWK